MFEEFYTYLRYDNLRYVMNTQKIRKDAKGLYALTLLSMQQDIVSQLGDKITFLAWLEYNDKFFDRLDEKQQKFLKNTFLIKKLTKMQKKFSKFSQKINIAHFLLKQKNYHDKKRLLGSLFCWEVWVRLRRMVER